MAPRFPPGSELLHSIQVWCFDLYWGGQVFHVATQALDLDLEDGSRVFYEEALGDVDVRDEVAREGIQESASVPLAMYLDVDIAERIARGYRLEQARGELFAVTLHRDTRQPDQTFAQRYPVLSGRLSRPVYADPERNSGFLKFTLEDNPGDDQNLIVEADAAITEETWSGAPDDSIGKVYPIVIGTPGVFRKASGASTTTSGSPAYVVEVTGANADTLLIAGHDVEASTVLIYDAEGNSESLPVAKQKDGLGRLVAVVDISTPASIGRQSSEYWACWNGGGALRSPFGSHALTALGEVCAWALLRSSLPVDIAKWLAEGGLLDRIDLSFYINEETLTPWSLVTRLIESVQVEVRAGPDGLYPQARWLNIDNTEALTTLVEGQDLEPVGPVTTRTQLAEVVNKVIVRFAPRARTGDYKRTVIVEADPDTSNSEAFSDEYAALSVNRWTTDPEQPVVRAETLTLDHVYDDTSAALIAQERIQTRGFGYAERAYLASVNLGWLRAGDQFLLESASLHRTLLVTVISRTWTGTAFAFVLALDEDPVRDGALKKTGT